MAEFDELTPEEHQAMLKDFVPDSHGLHRLWKTGFLTTLGLHLAMVFILILAGVGQASNRPLILAVTIACIVGVSFEIILRGHFLRSSSVGGVAVLLLVLCSFVAPQSAVLGLYAIVGSSIAYAEARASLNAWGVKIFLLYSAVFLSQQPSSRIVSSVVCGCIGLWIIFAFVRKRKRMLVSCIGSALVYALRPALQRGEAKDVFLLSLILVAFTGAFFLEFRGAGKDRSDLSLFLGSSLIVLTAATGLALVGITNLVLQAVGITLVVTALLMVTKGRALASVCWILIFWLLACWQSGDEPLIIWGSLALCVSTAYFGTWRENRFLQVSAWLLGLPVAGWLCVQGAEPFSLSRCAGAINYSVFVCVTGSTLFQENKWKWWNGIIPASIYHPGVELLKAYSIRVGKLPFISGVVAAVAIPLSWVRSSADAPSPFTLRSLMILSGHLLGAMAVSHQATLYVVGSSSSGEAGTFVSVVVWTIWGTGLSSWASLRSYPLFTLMGIIFILWPLVYDLSVDHWLIKNLQLLAFAVVGTGLWISGLWGTTRATKWRRDALSTPIDLSRPL